MGFNIYVCQMSHTSTGGTMKNPSDVARLRSHLRNLHPQDTTVNIKPRTSTKETCAPLNRHLEEPQPPPLRANRSPNGRQHVRHSRVRVRIFHFLLETLESPQQPQMGLDSLDRDQRFRQTLPSNTKRRRVRILWRKGTRGTLVCGNGVWKWDVLFHTRSRIGTRTRTRTRTRTKARIRSRSETRTKGRTRTRTKGRTRNRTKSKTRNRIRTRRGWESAFWALLRSWVRVQSVRE